MPASLARVLASRASVPAACGRKSSRWKPDLRTRFAMQRPYRGDLLRVRFTEKTPAKLTFLTSAERFSPKRRNSSKTVEMSKGGAAGMQSEAAALQFRRPSFFRRARDFTSCTRSDVLKRLLRIPTGGRLGQND